MVMKNTMTMKEKHMRTSAVPAIQPVAVLSRMSVAAAASRSVGGRVPVEADAQELFEEQLLATFSDRWEW